MGYVLELQITNATTNRFLHNRVLLSRLRRNGWIDEATRSLLVSFSLLNSETKTIVYALYMVEAYPSGLVLTTSKVSSFGLSMYMMSTAGPISSESLLLIIGDCVLGMYSVFLLYKFGNDVLLFGLLNVLSTLWNVLSVAVSLLIVARIIMCVVFDSFTSTLSLHAPVELSMPVLFRLMDLHDGILLVSAFLVFFGVLLIFKFTQLDIKLSVFFQTINNLIRGSLLSYLFIYIICILTVSMAGILLFNTSIGDDSNNMYSLTYIVLIANGLIASTEDYLVNYRQSNLTVSFFFTFVVVVVVYLVLFHLLAAIVIDSYFETSLNFVDAKLLSNPLRLIQRSSEVVRLEPEEEDSGPDSDLYATLNNQSTRNALQPGYARRGRAGNKNKQRFWFNLLTSPYFLFTNQLSTASMLINKSPTASPSQQDKASFR